MSFYEDLVAAWVPARHKWLWIRPAGEELINSLGKQRRSRRSRTGDAAHETDEATESAEFESIYKLKVTSVPTNRPKSRKYESDVVYRATMGKWRAVVVETSRMNKTGRPVLVGTTSVEQSDSLSGHLKEAGIPHEKQK